MSESTKRSPLTTAVHGGEPRSYPYDALAAPIAQTATYSFANTEELIHYFEGRIERMEYGRYGNPTVALVEKKVAALEGVEDAAAFRARIPGSELVIYPGVGHMPMLEAPERTVADVITFLGLIQARPPELPGVMPPPVSDAVADPAVTQVTPDTR